MPYYTGKGDDGYSCLLGKGRFSKDYVIFEAIGEVDELNSAIGMALYYTRDRMVRATLRRVQNDLFIIGAGLASYKIKLPKTKLKADAVKTLEKDINNLDGRIPKLKAFVIPGGCESSAHLHLARAIARKLERWVVAKSKKGKVDPNFESYMNRLSSYLFVAAVYMNYISGIKESHPTY
jgi:cob(I)alamin adenosyltransferase